MVDINPESRVKVARGPAKANSSKWMDKFFWEKYNEEAVTAQ